MNFYIIAYSILFVMIAAFAITVYKLLNKLPDVTPEQKETVSPDNTEETADGAPVKEEENSDDTPATEEEYSASTPALSYFRNGRKKQRMHFIRYKSPYYGTNEIAVYYPRLFTKRKFDDVKGIIIENKFVLLREIFLTRMLPGDICEIAKQFEGHLPTEEQIKKVFEYKDEISKMLEIIGEEPLDPREYLYVEEGATYDYCLNFENGNDYPADCDENVSAFLVMEL
ncbi:MAG: hypothetical protein J6T72_04360 [Alphaproteobacteria bacterium]|nr:hypothetical protein [Alphaproteobacteria bacterium]